MQDLISRQAAIRWVKTECNPYGKPTLEYESGKRVMEHLEQMPSAEPKTGEWIMKHDGVIFKRTWGVCSRCGNTLDFDGLNAGRGDANYCPNCGARMTPYKGGDDE